jgi:short-subunit dehydrogenase
MDQKDVLVIGGSSGIGYEIARQLIARSAHVIIVGRDSARLAAAAERLDGSATTLAFDAHDEAALEAALAGLDAIDHLVSMIGDSMAGGFMTTE